MAVSLYDDALLKKLKSWTEKTEVEVYGVDQTRRLFEVIADKNDDKPIKLPIICLSRVGGYTVTNINKRPYTYDGFTLDSDGGFSVVDKNTGDVLADSILTYDEALRLRDYYQRTQGSIMSVQKSKTGYSTQLNVIPISISYRLDVYTRYMKEADDYMRELVFNFINHPNIKVVIPYNGVESQSPRDATVRISEEIEDNSDVPEIRLAYGQFTRMSLYLNIDDAYLFDTRIRSNVEIGASQLSVAVHSSENDVIIEKV